MVGGRGGGEGELSLPLSQQGDWPFPPGLDIYQIIGILEALTQLLRTNIIISNKNAECSLLKGGFYSKGFIFQPILLLVVFLQKTFLNGCVFANVFI